MADLVIKATSKSKKYRLAECAGSWYVQGFSKVNDTWAPLHDCDDEATARSYFNAYKGS